MTEPVRLRRETRRPRWRLAVIMTIATMLAAVPATHAEAAARAGHFLCQSNVVRIGEKVWTQANPAENPCVDNFTAADRQDITVLTLFRLQSSVVDARTDQSPDLLESTPPAEGDAAKASARLASVRLTGPGMTVEFGAIHSDAVATCVAGTGGLVPSYTARSTITTLRVNGTEIVDITGPRTITLPVGKLLLNVTITTTSGISRRAAVWDTPWFDLIVGEARASTDANPCR